MFGSKKTHILFAAEILNGDLKKESDKFVGIDMDVKEILMNGYQIKAAKEFCNQGPVGKLVRGSPGN